MRAKPAPLYIRLPAVVLEAYLAGRIGAGHLTTAVRIYRLLWGKQRPLEGSTAEFVEALGIEERTFQRHLAALGSNGCVLCDRPQYGQWIVDVPPGSGADPDNFDGLPVVVSESVSGMAVGLDPGQQQSSSEKRAGEPTILSGCQGEPTELSGCVQALEALLRIGMQADVAAELAARCEAGLVLDAVAYATTRQVENPAGWVRRALEDDWTFRRRKRTHRPEDYTSSQKYGDEAILR